VTLICVVAAIFCVDARVLLGEMLPFVASAYARETVASELDRLRADLAASAASAPGGLDWNVDELASSASEWEVATEIPWRRTNLGWENSATWDIEPRPTTTTDLATAVHPLLVGLMALLLSLAALVAFDDSSAPIPADAARR
jgi:hypothetical protein